MSDKVISDLQRRVARLEREAVRVRSAEVVGTDPLMVELGSSGKAQRAATFDREHQVALQAGAMPPIVPDGPTPWMDIGTNGSSFGAGWGHYPGWGGGQFRKVGDVVQLRGLIQRTSGTGMFLFSLPEGFHSPVRILVGADTGEPGVAGRIDIGTNGIFTLFRGGTNYVTLTGIWFSTV